MLKIITKRRYNKSQGEHILNTVLPNEAKEQVLLQSLEFAWLGEVIEMADQEMPAQIVFDFLHDSVHQHYFVMHLLFHFLEESDH